MPEATENNLTDASSAVASELSRGAATPDEVQALRATITKRLPAASFDQLRAISRLLDED